jgi:hypothetical protein
LSPGIIIRVDVLGEMCKVKHTNLTAKQMVFIPGRPPVAREAASFSFRLSRAWASMLSGCGPAFHPLR